MFVTRRNRTRSRSECHSVQEGLAIGASAVLCVILVSISVAASSAAQGTSVPRDGVSAATFASTNVLDLESDPDPATAACWLDALRNQACGIDLEPVYCGEVFTKARGGMATNNATRYQALLDLPLTIDFERARFGVPGKFFLLAQNTHGRGLTEDVIGDTLVLSDIDSFDNIMQVSEYWWEFGVLDDAVTIRLGKQDLNTEFVYMDPAADFIQSSFELTPNAALPSYPHPAMAAVALIQLDESLQLKAGVWDALAAGSGWGFSGQDTVLVIGELEYSYALLGGMLPGKISACAGYLSKGEVSGLRFGAVRGYSVQLEQLVYRESASTGDEIQGLAIFCGCYPRSPGSPVLEGAIGDSLAAGLVYTGLLPRRDADVLGVGVAWAELFQGGTNQETVFEFFYKAEITPRISIQPDLQYIVTPSGIHRDALAVGVRFQVTL